MGYFDQIVAHIGQRTAMHCFSAGDGTEIQLTAVEDGFRLTRDPGACVEIGLPYPQNGAWKVRVNDGPAYQIDLEGAKRVFFCICGRSDYPSSQFTHAVLAALTKALELHAQDRMLLREFEASSFTSYAVVDLASKLGRIAVHEREGDRVSVTLLHGIHKTTFRYDRNPQERISERLQKERISERLQTHFRVENLETGLSAANHRKLIYELALIIFEQF